MTRLFTPFGGEIQSSGSATTIETGPEFTWTAGVVTRIDYDSGNYKLFFYNIDGLLERIDYQLVGSLVRKTIFYNIDNTVDYITEVVL